VAAGKTNWKGEDDLKISPPSQPKDDYSNDTPKYALEAQRIRTFIILYTPADNSN